MNSAHSICRRLREGLDKSDHNSLPCWQSRNADSTQGQHVSITNSIVLSFVLHFHYIQYKPSLLC